MKQLHNYLLILSFLAFGCTDSTKYDLLIKGGNVYDGLGNPPIQADIGIQGDRIVAIGQLGNQATQIQDASGKAVAPGFINMLSWANVTLLHDGRSQSDIRQGVTLEVMGEGSSMGPLSPEMKANMQEQQGEIKFDVAWNTLGEYLQHLEKKGVSTNVASFVGNGTLRRHVIGNEGREATQEELDKMKALTEQAMQEGAVGISSSLLYVPSKHANTEELIALSKVVAEYNGMYISHIRSEGEGLIASIKELIRISREAGLSAEVYHLKASGEKNWNKLDSAISLIEAARDEGLPVTADMYTYPASSTGLHVQLPNWVREGGIEDMISKLKDPATRKKVLDELEYELPPTHIMLVGFRNPDLRKYAGMRLTEVAEQLGKSPEEATVDLIVEDDSRIQVVYFSMSEDNIRKKIQQPWMSFCSDAGSMASEGVFLKQSTHPRAYGSFIRVLGKYSREEGLYPLEEGIRRLSSLPAQNLKLKNRGSLQEGNFADIVIFDPATVKDHATFEKPHQYATGVEEVFVNGVQVLKNGEHTGAMPGMFVKGPGYKMKE